MWNVNPKLMCRKHLLGEHLEMHMFAGCINKGKSLVGYIRSGLVETGNIQDRHFALAKEMERRGYNHNSPLFLEPQDIEEGRVDVQESLRELRRRCEECRKRMK
jgi:hypothetical protein